MHGSKEIPSHSRCSILGPVVCLVYGQSLTGSLRRDRNHRPIDTVLKPPMSLYFSLDYWAPLSYGVYL